MKGADTNFMNSKVCYGKTFLEIKDLKETNIKNMIELEYYRTKKSKRRFFKDDCISYGIEVIKKEYRGRKINIEKEKIDKISSTRSIIDDILSKLQKFKVTPIGLKDVVDDMIHN